MVDSSPSFVIPKQVIEISDDMPHDTARPFQNASVRACPGRVDNWQLPTLKQIANNSSIASARARPGGADNWQLPTARMNQPPLPLSAISVPSFPRRNQRLQLAGHRGTNLHRRQHDNCIPTQLVARFVRKMRTYRSIRLARRIASVNGSRWCANSLKSRAIGKYAAVFNQFSSRIVTLGNREKYQRAFAILDSRSYSESIPEELSHPKHWRFDTFTGLAIP